MYTVIGTVKSRALRVIWMLEELDVQFDHIAAPPQSEGVIQVSPSGKVPVLVEDGVPITDSTAILQYLADKHGQFTHPAGTLDLALPATPLRCPRGPPCCALGPVEQRHSGAASTDFARLKVVFLVSRRLFTKDNTKGRRDCGRDGSP